MIPNQKLRAALESILAAAEDHPCFAGHAEDMDRDEIQREGGDIAFVTLDIAWVARSALIQSVEMDRGQNEKTKER